MMTTTLEISLDRETMQPRILIADDQQDVLDALRLLLKGHGYSIETVNSPADLLAAVARQEFDILLIDLNYARDTTSGREGLDVLSRLREIADPPPVVAMTGWATVGLAVEAITDTGEVIRFGKDEEKARQPKINMGLLGLAGD